MPRLPSPVEISREITALGGVVSAIDLCRALENAGFATAQAQLGMQRATDSGAVVIGADWKLALPAS